MKKRITLIIILMSVSVAGVIGLQAFWNYQNYRNTVRNFDRDINEALRAATDREIALRRHFVAREMIRWMNDTSLVGITCNNHNRDSQTVFTIKDRHPYTPKEKGISMGINDFKQSLTRITPEAKQYFIEHFANNIVLQDIEKGSIYYYTQHLGDSLTHAFFKSRLDTAVLASLYTEELKARGIHSAFSFGGKARFQTQAINASLRRPYEKEMIAAGFESPDYYFIKKMKWLILTTILLVVIILSCFVYTLRTLLSQNKLAELKNSFINNMTHELNTPLASIKITVEALRTFQHDPERLQEYLSIISYQNEKLADLAARILDANKLIRQKETAWTLIDVDTLLNEAVHTLKPQFDSSQAAVSYQGTPATVKGEYASLLNALTNLMDNAVKYNQQASPALDISTHVAAGQVVINLADNGPGIPPEFRQKIFEPFFRVPQGNRHDVKGYGLGLSYVRQVVESHQGAVTFIANHPHGSIFTIKLPLG